MIKAQMKKSQIVLFLLRLLFYFSVLALILIHPGITITFDRIGIVQWFIIIPLMALLAFLPKFTIGNYSYNAHSRIFISGITLTLLSMIAGGFGLGAVQPFFAGLLCFVLTFLLFHFPIWAKASVLEPFFLAWVCLRLLALSRSGEDVAGQSMALTQFIFVWTGAVFLLHGVVIYFCLYPYGRGKSGREGAIFAFSAAAVLFLLLFVLPPDFVRNRIVENLVQDRMPEKIGSDSEKGLPKGGGDQNRRRLFPGGEKERRNELRGVSERNWQNRTGRGKKGSSEESKQYMVMVVASPREPVYMGSSFNGQLDPVAGFLPSENEPLNRIALQRHFVTWFDNEPDYDEGRVRMEVFALSTLAQKYLPYRPVIIDPTILSQNSGPLRYIHQVVSNFHTENPLELVRIPSRSFSGFENSMLSPYLEVNLDTADIKLFEDYLDKVIEYWYTNSEEMIQDIDYLSWIFYGDTEANEDTAEDERQIYQRKYVNEYLEKIFAILVNFKDYQYNLSFNDDAAIAELKEFLFETKDGDCVEFSNTLALLGRLAGIPSRVVTGYLAARELQTRAHMQGLVALREQIPSLREYPLNDMYLVTNLAHHSWVQFYIPDYGWLDFEATTFALPPVGSGDFNTWDVVIPIIEEEKTFSQVRKFPWIAVLKAVGLFACFALVAAYVIRYVREAVLYFGARRGGRAGARSLYLLLLARLAADGKPIKPASKTALEYRKLFQLREGSFSAAADAHFRDFALLYSELRWREFKDEAERDKRFQLLREEYDKILETTRAGGIGRWFIRLISLRGLAYL